MDVGALAVGLLGGGAIGTVGTAVYTSAHDRVERVRERMVAAADDFLAEVEKGRVIAMRLEWYARLFGESQEASLALLKKAREGSEGSAERPEIASELNVALRASVAAMASTADDPGDVEALPERVRALLEEASMYTGPAARVVEAFVDGLQAVERHRKVASRLRTAVEEFNGARLAARERIPRVMIVFPARADSVSVRAAEVVGALEDFQGLSSTIRRESDATVRAKMNSHAEQSALDARCQELAVAVRAEMARVSIWGGIRDSIT